MSYTNPLPNVKGMTSLKVDNLANRTSYSTLKRVFEAYGPVGDVYIPQNHLTKERYGFAFIHFLNKRDAKNATDALNGILLDGCKLRVQMMHNNDPRYTQPDYAQRGQHQYEEDNHESQSHSEKDCCPTDMIQSTSHSTYSSDHLQSGTQSHYLHRRLSSTRRSKSKSSMSNQQLPDKSRPRSRNLTHAKGKKSKSRSSCRNPSKCPEGGGRLLGEENMENNQKQVKNVGSNSLFKRPHISEGNTTETSMEVVPTRSQIRRRQENPDNCRERPWMERELMEYNKRQREYPQSQSTLTTESKEDEPEIVMVYNRFQKRARTNLQLPKANDWNRCGANTSNVVPGGESERGQHTSFRQSEGQTQRETVRCGFSKTKYQSNTKNYISEEMRFTFNNENLNPENDYALLSRLRSHGSNRNSQTQINHLQPKSTYTPEEGTTEILVDNTMSRDRECTRSESPDVVIVGEVNESRIP
ncbi:serine/arginine-rich splicing factor 8-like, partial [Phodopus roborovskii]|uniref:serine/arginine-rich splicing factor 8-like n=1 Tax=Phodopus roborovskii TaxID=109678 RepID=UPI0021E5043C